jgi:hypothetical protein
MPKKIILIFTLTILLAVLTFPVYLIASGRFSLNSTEEIKIEKTYSRDFKKLLVDFDAAVFVNKGEANSVVVEGARALVNQVEIKETSKTLQISQRSGVFLDFSLFRSAPQTRIYITLVAPEEFEFLGNSKVNLLEISSPQVDINFQSSQSLEITNLQVQKLIMKNYGTGFVNITGQGNSLELETANSGRTQMRNFVVEKAVLNIRGNGGVEINAAESIELQMEENSSVGYIGTPEITEKIPGMGRVRRL